MLSKRKAFERDVLPADLPEETDLGLKWMSNLMDWSNGSTRMRDFYVFLLDYLQKILSHSLQKDPTKRPSTKHICLLFSFWEWHLSNTAVFMFFRDSSRQGFRPLYLPADWLPMTAGCKNLRGMFDKYMIWMSETFDLSQVVALKYFMLVVTNPKNGLSEEDIKSQVESQVEKSLFQSSLPLHEIVSRLVDLAGYDEGTFAWCLLDCIEKACRRKSPLPCDLDFWAWGQLAKKIPAGDGQTGDTIQKRFNMAIEMLLLHLSHKYGIDNPAD